MCQKNREKSSVAVVVDHLYPGDKEVLITLAEETDLDFALHH